VDEAVADADRAAELARIGGSFQSLCDPLAFRARLHTENGEGDAAAQVNASLVDAWTETRSVYLDHWVLDAWYVAWRTGDEERLGVAISSMPANAWSATAASMIDRDFAGAVAHLDEMGAASVAALARLWAAEWLVEHGRTAQATPFLEHSLAFWRSVGASAYTRAASRCSQPPREGPRNPAGRIVTTRLVRTKGWRGVFTCGNGARLRPLRSPATS
jgi:hypothetical protein